MDWIITEDRPIFQQLYEQLARRIVSGVYTMGGRLPSVRELAGEAGVNPNTMQRALAMLETEGLAEANRTLGRAVTTDEARISAVRTRLAKQAAEKYLETVRALGLTDAEAAALLKKEEL